MLRDAEWELFREGLSCLWDEVDLDPAVGDTLKEQLGMAKDYFSAAPIEPTPTGLEESRASLRRICRCPRAWGGDVV